MSSDPSFQRCYSNVFYGAGEHSGYLGNLGKAGESKTSKATEVFIPMDRNGRIQKTRIPRQTWLGFPVRSKCAGELTSHYLFASFCRRLNEKSKHRYVWSRDFLGRTGSTEACGCCHTKTKKKKTPQSCAN